jgi:acetate kinase
MDRVLLLNAGSSTLKWALAPWSGPEVESSGTMDWSPHDPAACSRAIGAILERSGSVVAVGHRVVHGGERFRSSVRITVEVRDFIASLADIDPLHAPLAIAGIDAVSAALPDVPQVAAFDTAFHASIPSAASRYAIPNAWTERFRVRRFGFHGLSVAYAVRRAAQMLGEAPRRMVVCHLGSGCSATAVLNSASVDTTMGYTPLEGIVMSTRSGSVDPGLLISLLRRGLTNETIDRGLEHESGLLALARSADFRTVLAAADAGSAEARLAIEVFEHSVIRHVGSLVGVLGGLDALVFTGGIGEHASALRANVASHFAFAGISVDSAANERAHADAIIGATAARAQTLVITAREDLALLAEVRAVLGSA